MTTASKRRKKDGVTVSGPWLPMPLDFLASRACAGLSPHAIKMLIDMCGQLGPNARGNGDISAAQATLNPKGWAKRNATRVAALDELVRAGLLCLTRHGDRRRCSLYAVTLWPMHCDFSKLDHGPGSYTTQDWRNVSKDGDKRPSAESPVTWAGVRKNKSGDPATGQPSPDMSPPRDKRSHGPPSYAPTTGSKQPIPALRVVSPRDTYLDKPSAVAVTATY